MSSIATIIRIPTSALSVVRASATPKESSFGKTRDEFQDVLRKHGTEVATYGWSGFVIATLLVYLDEVRNIPLIKSESFQELAEFLSKARDGSFVVLSAEHRKVLPELDPTRFPEDELRDYFNEFNETDEEGIGQAMRDGIAFLARGVEAIDDASIALVKLA